MPCICGDSTEKRKNPDCSLNSSISRHQWQLQNFWTLTFRANYWMLQIYQCWWRVREEGEGKGREGESYKGWRRDADDLQWYSSAALSIPPLINTTLDPAIDSSSSWRTSSSPSEKPSPSVSLSLRLSVCVQKEAPNLLLIGYAGNWMIPKNKEDPCFFLSIKGAKSLATKMPGNFSVENPSSGLRASSSNRISCHKFPGNFPLLGISSSGLGGASSNIYLSCHKFQLCSGILTLRNLRSVKQEADLLPQNSSKLFFF